MTDKIEEIREKFERLTSHIALVSEEMRRQSDRADKAWAEVDKLRAENERLRAENERLSAIDDPLKQLNPSPYDQTRELMLAQIALMRLEGKP